MFPSHHRPDHARRINKSTENDKERKHDNVRAVRHAADGGTIYILRECCCTPQRQKADVILWTRLYTIHAECAIEIACLLGLKEKEFASSGAIVAPDTIMRTAASTDCGIFHRDLTRRDQGDNKVELADRTNILTKRSAAKGNVNQHSSSEISYYDPGSNPGIVPQAKCFITPEKNQEY